MKAYKININGNYAFLFSDDEKFIEFNRRVAESVVEIDTNEIGDEDFVMVKKNELKVFNVKGKELLVGYEKK